MHDSIEDINSF